MRAAAGIGGAAGRRGGVLCPRRKAVEDHRTPRRWRVTQRPAPREASWSAPVLWRFCFAAGRREAAPAGMMTGEFANPPWNPRGQLESYSEAPLYLFED